MVKITPNSGTPTSSDADASKTSSQRPRTSRCRSMLYLLDSFLSQRRYQMLMVLVMIALSCIGGGLLFMMVPHSVDYIECDMFQAMWYAWTFLADSGTQAAAKNLGERLVAFSITLMGIFLFTVITGFVVEEIREKMDTLKKGKSSVVESGHTLVLGFTDKTVGIILEIAMANESDGGGTIVVLAKGEKQTVESEIYAQLRNHNLCGTRVVVRSGTPLYVADLEKVSARTARSIIVLANDEEASSNAARADANTLRVVLALCGLGSAGSVSLRGHIVAELRDVDNTALVKMAGGKMVDTFVSHDIIGRLMLLSARQPGLAKVYRSVLGFEGHEFYLQEWPQLIGAMFGEVHLRFKEAIPIGVKTTNGTIVLKPSQGRRIKAGDQILVIAEDDDTYSVSKATKLARTSMMGPTYQEEKPRVEKILICGWRRDIRDIVSLLDAELAPNSEVHMLCRIPVRQRDALLRAQGLDVRELERLELVHHEGIGTSRRCLETIPLEHLTSVMILADESNPSDVINSDSRVLATLLLIKDMQAQIKRQKQAAIFSSAFIRNRINQWGGAKRGSCTIVCELRDFRTQRTVMENRRLLLASDFVQSNMLISQTLAMVSENRGVKLILDELLGPHGCHLSLYPAARYVHKGETCSFWTLCARAAQRDHIACGYQEHMMGGKTVLNPADKKKMQRWDGIDIIVLSGDGLMANSDSDKARSILKLLRPKETKSAAFNQPAHVLSSQKDHPKAILKNSPTSQVKKLTSVLVGPKSVGSNRNLLPALPLDAPFHKELGKLVGAPRAEVVAEDLAEMEVRLQKEMKRVERRMLREFQAIRNALREQTLRNPGGSPLPAQAMKILPKNHSFRV